MLRSSLNPYWDMAALEARDLLPAPVLKADAIVVTDHKAVIFIVVIVKDLQG